MKCDTVLILNCLTTGRVAHGVPHHGRRVRRGGAALRPPRLGGEAGQTEFITYGTKPHCAITKVAHRKAFLLNNFSFCQDWAEGDGPLLDVEKEKDEFYPSTEACYSYGATESNGQYKQEYGEEGGYEEEEYYEDEAAEE